MKKHPITNKPTTSFVANTSEKSNSNSVLCKTENHPLYICSKFKTLSHGQMVSILRGNDMCLNCLKPGHFVRQCKSLYRCRKCQKPHHTLLHTETTGTDNSTPLTAPSLAASGMKTNSLLMTFGVIVSTPNGLYLQARAILNSALSASFISERLVHSLHLRLLVV